MTSVQVLAGETFLPDRLAGSQGDCEEERTDVHIGLCSQHD